MISSLPLISSTKSGPLPELDAQQDSSFSSLAPAPRTPPGDAKEGADLVQHGSSSSSPAPAPHTPPGGAKEGADLVQQGSGISSPAPAPRTPTGDAKEGADLVQQGSSFSSSAPAQRTPSVQLERKARTSSSGVVADAVQLQLCARHLAALRKAQTSSSRDERECINPTQSLVLKLSSGQLQLTARSTTCWHSSPTINYHYAWRIKTEIRKLVYFIKIRKLVYFIRTVDKATYNCYLFPKKRKKLLMAEGNFWFVIGSVCTMFGSS